MSFLGAPHSHAGRLDHDQAASKQSKVCLAHEVLHKPGNSQSFVAPGPEQDDPWMSAWWVLPQVAELHVRGEQHPAFAPGGGSYAGIGFTEKLLVGDRGHIVAKSGQAWFQVTRQILVQLDSHVAMAAFHTFSLESSAA